MKRHGVTLIELLIALAISLIMMGAIVTLFANMTNTVTESRAVIELTDKLRTARDTLQNDLAGHTAPMRPPLDPGKDQGFLELMEGLNYFDYGSMFDPISGASTFPKPTYNASLQPPASPTHTRILGSSILGDVDDIVHLTVRSNGKPFAGRVGTNAAGNPNMMESQTAEVIWFLLPNGRTITNPATNIDTTTKVASQDTSTVATFPLYTLYRRSLLVLPGYNLAGAPVNLSNVANAQLFYASYDLSAHYDVVTGQTIANTLGDLTKRENRFYHGTGANPSAVPVPVTATWPNNIPSGFPFMLNPDLTTPNANPKSLPNAILTGGRLGEDVILDNVLAFDVRVFDPWAMMVPNPLGSTGTDMLGPCDVGYPKPPSTIANLAGAGGTLGAYVDLGYGNITRGVLFWNWFGQFGNAKTNGGAGYSMLYNGANPAHVATYDTWSLHYEQNGYDEDNNGIIDQGFDGLDNASTAVAINGIVDDPRVVDPTTVATPSPGEQETMSPFPYPLRAMQVVIRVYEPDSRQVRQVTVVQDFVPE